MVSPFQLSTFILTPVAQVYKEPSPISDIMMTHDFVPTSWSGLRVFYWASIQSPLPNLCILILESQVPDYFIPTDFLFVIE